MSTHGSDISTESTFDRIDKRIKMYYHSIVIQTRLGRQEGRDIITSPYQGEVHTTHVVRYRTPTYTFVNSTHSSVINKLARTAASSAQHQHLTAQTEGLRYAVSSVISTSIFDRHSIAIQNTARTARRIRDNNYPYQGEVHTTYVV